MIRPTRPSHSQRWSMIAGLADDPRPCIFRTVTNVGDVDITPYRCDDRRAAQTPNCVRAFDQITTIRPKHHRKANTTCKTAHPIKWAWKAEPNYANINASNVAYGDFICHGVPLRQTENEGFSIRNWHISLTSAGHPTAPIYWIADIIGELTAKKYQSTTRQCRIVIRKLL